MYLACRERMDPGHVNGKRKEESCRELVFDSRPLRRVLRKSGKSVHGSTADEWGFLRRSEVFAPRHELSVAGDGSSVRLEETLNRHSILGLRVFSRQLIFVNRQLLFYHLLSIFVSILIINNGSSR